MGIDQYIVLEALDLASDELSWEAAKKMYVIFSIIVVTANLERTRRSAGYLLAAFL